MVTPMEPRPSPTSPIVLGYYPAWRTGLPPEGINYRLFTHLAHAFARVDRATGAVRTTDDVPNKELLARAHAAGVRVPLSVGGADSGRYLNPLMQSAQSRGTLVTSLVEMVQVHGYDGIDVDWEFPLTATDTASLVSLVEELDAALREKAPQAQVTMAVPATDYYGRWYAGHQLEAHVDFLNVMTYDLHGPWKSGGGAYSHAGHNSPLRETSADPVDGKALSFERFVAYWEMKHLPTSKLLVGIPCFGHGFAVDAWGKSPTKASSYPELPYARVLELLADGWKVSRDAEAGVPWLGKDGVEEIISYDDPTSVAEKGKWAKARGVRGIFFWDISQDMQAGENVLVRAARDAFLP